MKNLTASLLLLVGLAAVSSCKKDNETPAAPSDTMTISGDMNAANTPSTPTQPGPVVSSGTGKVTGTYNKTTKELEYTVTYSGLTGPATNGHFHIGAPGTLGKVAVGFTNYQTSPITGKVTLRPEQADELLKGNFYANLHTAQYKEGEIRANVVVK